MKLQGWEAVIFYVLAVMTLVMGVLVVTARVAVHSALFLISALVNIALLFILLRSEFVAGVQILVYVGGVMVLFLFVIMLVQTRAEEESRVQLYTSQMGWAVGIAIMLALSVFFAIQPAQGAFRPRDAASQTAVDNAARTGAAAGAGYISSDTQNVGEALYKQAALPFEIASLLLLVAIVGAVLLARGTKQEKMYD